MHVPFLLPPLLVVQLRVVAVVLPAVSLALFFSLSPLVVGLLLPLPVLLPADRAAAALQVPNKQNPRKVSVSSDVTRRRLTTVFPVRLGSARYNYVQDISSRRAFKNYASKNPKKKWKHLQPTVNRCSIHIVYEWLLDEVFIFSLVFFLL